MGAITISSCKSEIDNYPGPQGGVFGTIYDKETNEPIPLPTQGSGGVLMSLYELNVDATATTDFRANQDGTYKNTKVFNGDYKLKATGPFVGVSEGNVTVNGQTKLDIYAIPLARVNATANISDDNKLKIDYQIDKIADNTFQLTDVAIIWNYAPGVDVNSANYATLLSAGPNLSGSFEINLMNDTRFIENHFKIKSNQNKVYARVAATVTVNRGGTVKATAVNYSKVLTLTVKDIN